MTIQDVRQILRSYVLSEFLEGEDPGLLTDETALVSSGVLNSLALIKLIAFVEKQFHVKISVREMDELDTIAQLERLVLNNQEAPS